MGGLGSLRAAVDDLGVELKEDAWSRECLEYLLRNHRLI